MKMICNSLLWKPENQRANIPLLFADQQFASRPSIEAKRMPVADSEGAFVVLLTDYFECIASFVSSAHTFARAATMSRFSLLSPALVLFHNVHHMDFQSVALAIAVAFPYVIFLYKRCRHAASAPQFRIHSNSSLHSERFLDLCIRRSHNLSVCHSLDRTLALKLCANQVICLSKCSIFFS